MDVISREYVEAELKRYKFPGMGIGVIKDGKVMMSEGFGYKDIEKKTKITGDTQFGIASCSKSLQRH
ncbi:MAG: serine hydrolase [Anaerovoracaceae bacterium]